MILPLAASATRDSSSTLKKGTTYIAPSLLQFTKTHADKEKVDVIIQSSGGVSAAHSMFATALLANGENNQQGNNGNDRSHDEKKLNLVSGISAQLSVRVLKWLTLTNGLVITPDAKVKTSSLTFSKQLWPYMTGNAVNWPKDANLNMPAIAVVDSGIQNRSDFQGRLLASVNMSTLPNNSPGDGRGHGTFVAGIAAGASIGYAGAAPSANLVSVDVMDDTGTGSTSDIIAACQWILDNKDKYNIRVVNMSLHSSIIAPFYYDPLDKAVEKLWFNGITVITSAGNYGQAGVASDVKFSPGNDPFVITVGAADINGTVKTSDDTVAPWSAWGHTMDGFSKPELSAPGRYMVGPVPALSSLAILRADHLVTPGYMQLSGTSFAAPVVSGTAAQIIARHPNWTPGQVKGALMLSARPMKASVGKAGGVGEVTASTAANVKNPPNPNKALDTFVVPVSGGGVAFDSASWVDAAKANASWDSASWVDASWDSASWLDASWLDASWESASWLDASWLDASWLDASWLDASWEDAAEGDASPSGAYVIDWTQAADLTGDLATDGDVLPPGAIPPPPPPPPATPAAPADPAPTAPAADPAPAAPAPVAPAPDPPAIVQTPVLGPVVPPPPGL